MSLCPNSPPTASEALAPVPASAAPAKVVRLRPDYKSGYVPAAAAAVEAEAKAAVMEAELTE
eukprot:5885399-Pleurochrysis_carterae.AAC.1